MRRAFTMKRLVLALYMSISLLDRPAQANPEKAPCSNALDVGSSGFKNHGMPVLSDTTSIMLSKDGASIACGGTLNSGDTNLKFVMSGNPGDSEFLIDTVATAGIGSWGIQSGKCNNLRVYNSVGNSYTVPPSGKVTIRAAWSMGERIKISISPDCKYTVTGGPAVAPPTTNVKSTAATKFATWSTSLAALIMAVTAICYNQK